jgi:hypothetical protein
MKSILDQNQDGTVKWLEEVLTDGSCVYDIKFGNGLIHCRDFGEAEQLFITLTDGRDIEFDSINDDLRLPPGAILVDKRSVPNSEFLSVILCKWTRNNPEFVTWIYNHDAGGCTSGRYFHNIMEAAKDFNDRG